MSRHINHGIDEYYYSIQKVFLWKFDEKSLLMHHWSLSKNLKYNGQCFGHFRFRPTSSILIFSPIQMLRLLPRFLYSNDLNAFFPCHRISIYYPFKLPIMILSPT